MNSRSLLCRRAHHTRGVQVTLWGLCVITLGAMLSSSVAWAHICRYLKPDERNVCFVRNRESITYCMYVQDVDLNTYCYALAFSNPNRCAKIIDPEIKTQCTEEVGQRLEELKAERAAEAERKAQEKAEAEAEAARQAQAQAQMGQQPQGAQAAPAAQRRGQPQRAP